MSKTLPHTAALRIIQQSIVQVTGQPAVSPKIKLIDLGLTRPNIEHEFKIITLNAFQPLQPDEALGTKFLTTFTCEPQWTVQRTVREICTLLDIGLAGDPIPPEESDE